MTLLIWLVSLGAWLAVGAFGYIWYVAGMIKRDVTTDDLGWLTLGAIAGPISLLVTLTFLPGHLRQRRTIFKAWK